MDSAPEPVNILFIMYDQLRYDYLSCAGHPHLHTPNFDRVAKMGVRFTNAYVQSPICGASRMSFYTGRYTSSHGAQWNGFPLRVGEQTLGDHLRRSGMDCWLLGKTHMKADAEGMQRLGLSADSVIGARQAECGFDAWIRDDGLWGQGPDGFYDEKRSPYNEYLKTKGYPSENPWADFANAGVDDSGDMASGRTGPISCRRPITTCSVPTMCPRPCATRWNSKIPIRFSAPIWKTESPRPFSARRCARR